MGSNDVCELGLNWAKGEGTLYISGLSALLTANFYFLSNFHLRGLVYDHRPGPIYRRELYPRLPPSSAIRSAIIGYSEGTMHYKWEQCSDSDNKKGSIATSYAKLSSPSIGETNNKIKTKL